MAGPRLVDTIALSVENTNAVATATTSSATQATSNSKNTLTPSSAPEVTEKMPPAVAEPLKNPKKPRVRIEFWDADGCFYNIPLLKAIRVMLSQNAGFFQTYLFAKLAEQEIKIINEVLANILQDIKTTKGYRAQLAPEYYAVSEFELVNEARRYGECREQDLCLAELKEQNSEITTLTDLQRQKIHNNFMNAQGKDLTEIIEDFIFDSIQFIYRFAPDVMGQIAVEYNQELLQEIIAQKNEYDELKLMTFSQRQSIGSNMAGAQKNGSGCFVRDLEYVKKYLNKALPDKNVDVIKALLSDAYNSLPFATTYAETLKLVPLSLYGDDSVNPRNFHQHDETKFSIAYMLHAIADNPVNYTAIIRDDREDILWTLVTAFSIYPQLMASNIELKFNQYEGHYTSAFLAVVQGTGDPDKNLCSGLKYMAAAVKACVDKSSEKFAQEPAMQNQFGGEYQLYDVASALDFEKFIQRRAEARASQCAAAFFPKAAQTDTQSSGATQVLLSIPVPLSTISPP